MSGGLQLVARRQSWLAWMAVKEGVEERRGGRERIKKVALEFEAKKNKDANRCTMRSVVVVFVCLFVLVVPGGGTGCSQQLFVAGGA